MSSNKKNINSSYCNPNNCYGATPPRNDDNYYGATPPRNPKIIK